MAASCRLKILDTYAALLPSIDFQWKPVLSCVPCRACTMTAVISLERAGIPVYSPRMKPPQYWRKCIVMQSS